MRKCMLREVEFFKATLLFSGGARTLTQLYMSPE